MYKTRTITRTHCPRFEYGARNLCGARSGTSMNLQVYDGNGYRIIRVSDDIGPRSDLHEVRDVVEQVLHTGAKKIALAFTAASHLDSRAIGDLAACVALTRAGGCELAVIQPNPEIADFLRVVGFVRHVRIFTTEAELAAQG